MSSLRTLIPAAAILLLAGCTGTHSASLTPSAWSSHDRSLYGISRPDPVPLHGTYRTHAIAGTTGPAAIHIGEKVLEAGGTAADAAIATALGQIALAGGSWNSYAGIYMMVYYDAASGTTHSLNAGYNTVLGETDPGTIPAMGTASGRSTFVPGFVAGIQATHDKFGKLPLATLIEPSIDLAENGFVLSSTMGAIIDQRAEILKRRDETRAIFTKPDGGLWKAGDVFRQPALAQSLRNFASHGADYFYTGPWAERFVQAVQSDGGKITMEDMRLYRATWSQPLRTSFEGFEVCAIGLPETGGVQLVEALNLYQVADAKSLGSPATSAPALFRLMQIARFGYLPSFIHPVSTRADDPFAPENRATMAYAQQNLRRLDDPGFEMAFATELSLLAATSPAPTAPTSHSDSIVAIDSAGNIAALVHTSNNVTWGTTGIFVDGISIPDSAAFQQDKIALVGPGKRLPNATNPAIVFKGGRPYLVSGCIGSGLHEAALQNLINILAFDMDPKASLDAPMFLAPIWASFSDVAQGRRPQSVNRGEFPAPLLDAVRALGQPVTEFGRAEGLAQEGYWIGIQIDPKDGALNAAVSPRLIVAGAAEGK
ncbi:MAG: gamma-glutamyltransferase [Phycisphaerales bacterium]|nr:gamma-glutamyltransferase [Phycisphaerales bacterium]